MAHAENRKVRVAREVVVDEIPPFFILATRDLIEYSERFEDVLEQSRLDARVLQVQKTASNGCALSRNSRGNLGERCAPYQRRDSTF